MPPPDSRRSIIDTITIRAVDDTGAAFRSAAGRYDRFLDEITQKHTRLTTQALADKRGRIGKENAAVAMALAQPGMASKQAQRAVQASHVAMRALSRGQLSDPETLSQAHEILSGVVASFEKDLRGKTKQTQARYQPITSYVRGAMSRIAKAADDVGVTVDAQQQLQYAESLAGPHLGRAASAVGTATQRTHATRAGQAIVDNVAATDAETAAIRQSGKQLLDAVHHQESRERESAQIAEYNKAAQMNAVKRLEQQAIADDKREKLTEAENRARSKVVDARAREYADVTSRAAGLRGGVARAGLPPELARIMGPAAQQAHLISAAIAKSGTDIRGFSEAVRGMEGSLRSMGREGIQDTQRFQHARQFAKSILDNVKATDADTRALREHAKALMKAADPLKAKHHPFAAISTMHQGGTIVALERASSAAQGFSAALSIMSGNLEQLAYMPFFMKFSELKTFFGAAGLGSMLGMAGAIVQAGQAAKQTEIRMEAMVHSQSELNRIQDEAYNIAIRTGKSYNDIRLAMADLHAKNVIFKDETFETLIDLAEARPGVELSGIISIIEKAANVDPARIEQLKDLGITTRREAGGTYAFGMGGEFIGGVDRRNRQQVLDTVVALARKQHGGVSAELGMETLAGNMQHLRNAAGDLGRVLGSDLEKSLVALLWPVVKLAQGVRNVARAFEAGEGWAKVLVVGLRTLTYTAITLGAVAFGRWLVASARKATAALWAQFLAANKLDIAHKKAAISTRILSVAQSNLALAFLASSVAFGIWSTETDSQIVQMASMAANLGLIATMIVGPGGVVKAFQTLNRWLHISTVSSLIFSKAGLGGIILKFILLMKTTLVWAATTLAGWLASGPIGWAIFGPAGAANLVMVIAALTGLGVALVGVGKAAEEMGDNMPGGGRRGGQGRRGGGGTNITTYNYTYSDDDTTTTSTSTTPAAAFNLSGIEERIRALGPVIRDAILQGFGPPGLGLGAGGFGPKIGFTSEYNLNIDTLLSDHIRALLKAGAASADVSALMQPHFEEVVNAFKPEWQKSANKIVTGYANFLKDEFTPEDPEAGNALFGEVVKGLRVNLVNPLQGALVPQFVDLYEDLEKGIEDNLVAPWEKDGALVKPYVDLYDKMKKGVSKSLVAPWQEDGALHKDIGDLYEDTGTDAKKVIAEPWALGGTLAKDYEDMYSKQYALMDRAVKGPLANENYNFSAIYETAKGLVAKMIQDMIDGITLGDPEQGDSGSTDNGNGKGYAAGGIVRSRPGGRLVRLGEGGEDELVIPASKLREATGNAVATGGGATFNLTFNFPNLHSADRAAMDELADAVVAKISRQQRLRMNYGL